jgi:hypothetical protein
MSIASTSHEPAVRSKRGTSGTEKAAAKQRRIAATLAQFDDFADSMLVSLDAGCVIADMSRSKAYRLARSGQIQIIKVGEASKLRVGGLRQLIGAK